MANFKTNLFGEHLDIPMPPECDMVLVCVDLSQHKPVTVVMPHQVYRVRLERILLENPGARSITIMPYRNASKIQILPEEILRESE